jgi:hypothetical protein
MKNIIFLTLILLTNIVIAQTNYTIEYDLINDVTKYYQNEWVRGKQTEKQIPSFKIEKNDIITVRVINVNEYVYSVDVLNEVVRGGQTNSPVAAILSTFSGIGGPALNLLTSLASNPPDPIAGTRGDNTELDSYKEKCHVMITDMHRIMSEMLITYSELENNVAIKYSTTLTKDEIVDRLKENRMYTNASSMEDSYEKLNGLFDELSTLLEEDVLDYDDPLWTEIDDINYNYSRFTDICLDEYGDLKPYDINDIITEIENATFTFEHKYLGIDKEYTSPVSSNEFMIIFKNISSEEESSPIVNAKYYSIPVRQSSRLSWSAGVDFVAPLGGINDYSITQIDGDWWTGTPDSLLINVTDQKALQLSIGTKLHYDFPTKNNIILPSIIGGIGISGFNQDTEAWKLNLMLGGGLRFEKFPFIGLNAGFVLSQQRTLKNEFPEGRIFVQPDNVDSYDLSPLFKNVFKPGLFFGINFML